MKLGKELKEFIMRGNVVDLAVGVVIGGAFGAITTSLVNDIIMPFISLITGGADFSQWKWILKEGVLDPETQAIVGEVAVRYGNLLSVILNFIIIAVVLFFVVKGINKLKRPPEEPAPEAPAGPTTEELLGEIRDLLKEGK
ncbi:MAG: large-conductance mechanosensitive channel protein MscL [Oscillospiraceae bacterium]|nr:large-conductance mechanosensitive channel protein MscL [Oscillospiraceae bacterium]